MHIIGYHKEKLAITAEAGKTYYIRMKVVSGLLLTWRYHFEEVDTDNGRKEIEDSLLMADTPDK